MPKLLSVLSDLYIFAWRQKEWQGTVHFCVSFLHNLIIAFVFRMSMHSQNKGTLGNTFNNSQYFDGQK